MLGLLLLVGGPFLHRGPLISPLLSFLGLLYFPWFISALLCYLLMEVWLVTCCLGRFVVYSFLTLFFFCFCYFAVKVD